MSDAQPDLEALRREVERLRALSDATERRLRASHAVARVLAEETAEDAALPRTLAALGGALHCTLAAYWVPAGDVVECRATWMSERSSIPWDDRSRAHRFAPGEGLPGRIWRDRGPVWIQDVATDDNLPRHDLFAAGKIRSGFGFPLAAGSEVIGVIELFSRQPEPVDDHLVEVLRTLGGHLGQFVQHARQQARLRHEVERNARLLAEAQQTSRALDDERATLMRINELGRAISAQLEPRAITQAVIDVATQITGAQLGAFFYELADDHGETAMQYAVAGAPREAFAAFAIPRMTGVFAPTFTGRQVVRLDDVTADQRYGRNPPHHGLPEDHPEVRSYLATPVASRTGKVFGALLFGHAEPGVFTERAQQLASGLAAHAATALDNAVLFGEQQRLIKELEKMNAELDQFAYATSHDLRAPLRGISNLAGWIEEDLGTATPKKVREHIAMLKGRASRMDKLVNGLLELARIGRTRQKAERVDVTELLHETIDLLSPPAASRILIIGAMPTLNAERVALQQVFLNLIANAIQHSRRTDVVVRITAVERADEVELSIADNGVGIPAEHHTRVWEIFQTLHSRDVVETTGIGLTIVKKQVENHGGRAWIDPAHKDGADLRFTWPKRSK